MAGKLQILNANGKAINLINPDTLNKNLDINLDDMLVAKAPLNPTTVYGTGLSVDNTTITPGFNTTLYTGTGAALAVNTGVNMSTQWGNDVSETFGGLVWIKDRGAVTNHYLVDTISGNTSYIFSNSTAAAETNAARVTSFDSTGFTLGTDAALNTLSSNYVAYTYQTTHRITGTTNHNQPYECHYNPTTGFTMIKYTGSGQIGHEIPHHLNRELNFFNIKGLTTIQNWVSVLNQDSTSLATLALNTVDADNLYRGTYSDSNIVSIGVADTFQNSSGDSFIIYGWADSYFDSNNVINGNYEIGTYIGTGAAGNKIKTRGKPAYVMIKALSATGDWVIMDNLRTSFDVYVIANSTQAETAFNHIDVSPDGFTLQSSGQNIAGTTYTFMIIYDNDNGSGSSKYNKTSDLTNINLQGYVPFAKGIADQGSTTLIEYVNGTITLANALTEGNNYIAALEDGTYSATPYEPVYSPLSNRLPARTVPGAIPDVYDVIGKQWYSTLDDGGELISNGTFDTVTTGWTATAGATLSVVNGQLFTTGGSTAFDSSTPITVVAGQTYTLKWNLSLGTSTGVRITVGTTTTTNDVFLGPTSAAANQSGIHIEEFVAPITGTLYVNAYNQGVAGTDYYLDNVSVFVKYPTLSTTVQSRNYLDGFVVADQNLQPVSVSKIGKVDHFDGVQTSGNMTVDGNAVFNGGMELGQDWYDVSSERIAGVDYKNTTGKPIVVSINWVQNGTAGLTLVVDGVNVGYGSIPNVGANGQIVAVVQNNSIYSATGANTILNWSELR